MIFFKTEIKNQQLQAYSICSLHFRLPQVLWIYSQHTWVWSWVSYRDKMYGHHTLWRGKDLSCNTGVSFWANFSSTTSDNFWERKPQWMIIITRSNFLLFFCRLMLVCCEQVVANRMVLTAGSEEDLGKGEGTLVQKQKSLTAECVIWNSCCN